MPTDKVQPLTRCCPSHDDWTTLATHLINSFDCSAGDVLHELARAKLAIDAADLDEDDAYLVAELIVRHQLMLRQGELVEAAKLDPQRHDRRSSVARDG